MRGEQLNSTSAASGNAICKSWHAGVGRVHGGRVRHPARFPQLLQRGSPHAYAPVSGERPCAIALGSAAGYLRPRGRSIRRSRASRWILEIRCHRPNYLVAVVDQRYRRPPVERAAGMADSERPHLAQVDLQLLWYLEKRMLIIELRNSHTRLVASSTAVTVPPEDDGKLIIEGHVTSTEAHDR